MPLNFFKSFESYCLRAVNNGGILVTVTCLQQPTLPDVALITPNECFGCSHFKHVSKILFSIYALCFMIRTCACGLSVKLQPGLNTLSWGLLIVTHSFVCYSQKEKKAIIPQPT